MKITNRSVKKSLLHPFYIARIDFHSFCADTDIDPVEGSIHSDFWLILTRSSI